MDKSHEFDWGDALSVPNFRVQESAAVFRSDTRARLDYSRDAALFSGSRASHQHGTLQLCTVWYMTRLHLKRNFGSSTSTSPPAAATEATAAAAARESAATVTTSVGRP